MVSHLQFWPAVATRMVTFLCRRPGVIGKRGVCRVSACKDQDSPRLLCTACSGVSQSPARNVSPWILRNCANVPGRSAPHKTVPPFLLSPSAHPGNSIVTHTSNPYTLKSTGERQISLQLSQKTEERLTLPFSCQTSHSSSPNIPFFLLTTTLKNIYIYPQ